VSARGTFNDLQSSCGARCTGPAQQDQIATGKRDQAIANASLGFGIAGAVVATTFGVMLSRGKPGGGSASVNFGPGNVTIGGRF
jgi:hypothetical protein